MAKARHLGGLLLAATSGAACYGLYLYVPLWIRGTLLQSLGNLATFVAIIALLSLAELFWTFLTHRPPQAKS